MLLTGIYFFFDIVHHFADDSPCTLILPVCGLLFVFFSQSQCRVGPGRRGFSNGVGGLFSAALSSKSCLSVLSSWTSCNNINGPLNSRLCCAALVWVTSHTCTLSRSENARMRLGGHGGHTARTQGPRRKNPPVCRLAATGGGATSENLWPMIDHRRLLLRRSSRRPVCAPPLFVCLRRHTVGRVCVCSRLIICHTKSLARTHTYTEHWIVSITLSLI